MAAARRGADRDDLHHVFGHRLRRRASACGNSNISVTRIARGGPVTSLPLALLGSLFHEVSQPPLRPSTRP